MNPILIIKLGALGDVIMATAAIRQIQTHHGNAVLWLLTGDDYAPLFRNWPGLKVQSIPRHGLRAAIKAILWIRSRRFARVYDFQSSDRTLLYCALSGVPECVGNHPRFPYTHHPAAAWRGQCHISDRMLEVLRSAGIDARPERPWLPVTVEEVADVDRWLAGHIPARTPFTILHAGAGPRHPEKRWPFFAELAAALKEAHLVPVWIGGPQDAAVNARLAPVAGIDATGRFSLPQLLELGRRARFAVTNDSGPMHALSCAGIPVYGLFGPTDWRRTHAIGQGEKVITAVQRPGEYTPSPLVHLSAARVLERLCADGMLV